MKKILLSLVALAILAVSAQAITMETIAGIGSNNGGGVRHYVPVMDGVDAVFGYNLNIPLEKNGRTNGDIEVGGSFNLGLGYELPLLGEMTTIWTGSKGQAQGVKGQANNVSFIKDFLYNITDQVRVGLSFNVLTLGLEKGDMYATVKNNVSAVIAIPCTVFE